MSFSTSFSQFWLEELVFELQISMKVPAHTIQIFRSIWEVPGHANPDKQFSVLILYSMYPSSLFVIHCGVSVLDNQSYIF